ncbi:hypothetical protein DEI81_11880 [Curtobacterium sp. MCBD17_013]|uniref:glycoside hydrolase family 76 protein n=1 Tax=Curtobacterium sp. MCBD17_013 TaxID=2175668 RepID=UPI000DA980B1|nr:glycoside hydrolase family 76 protein [Curtobacterium sp. MCBD17_013]PZF60698.1 hypothetical protein DEI81_11880 [Curtobacterium sp. MCBD17_013]
MKRSARNRAGAIVAGTATAAVLAVLGGAPAALAAPAPDHFPPGVASKQNPVDTQRAVETYQALQANLYDPAHKLYVSSDAREPYGYLWDYVNGFAATDAVASLPGVGARYARDLQARDQGIQAYHDTHETSPTGAAQPPAYASGVLPPLGPDQPTYYDDNAWVGLDFLQQYAIDHQKRNLAQAEGVFKFAVSGWDTDSTGACPGGVMWEDTADSPRNTISNAPNAEVGLEIYQATRDPYYLTWATRMYNWARGCMMNANGMYYDHISPDGSIDQTLWSYNQGTMIGAGTLLYESTGNRTYLHQAEQTAAASVSYYGTNGNLYHQPDVFNAIFFRNLFGLAAINHDPSYARMAAAYADTAWVEDRQSNGLFNDPDASGGESPVNQTAPMVEIYALLAKSAPVYAATGSTNPSSVAVQPGTSGTTTLSIQSVEGRPQIVHWTAKAPAGLTVRPASGTLVVRAGGTASTPVSITGGTTDGNQQVTFAFSSTAGAVPSVTTSVLVARPGDLAPYYDNTGISDDSAQSTADLDGYGFSYSAQALAASGLTPGATVTSDGIQYDWAGTPGQPDNIVAAGQVLAVPSIAGATELGIIGSATNGPSTGPLTLTYTDGTTQQATLGFSDWTASSPSFGNGTAASTQYRNSTGGSSQGLGTHLYTTKIALEAGKTLASVTLPSRADQGLLHVFALGTDKGALTTAG